MKLYELTYLISPEVSEEELKSLREKVGSLVQKESGVFNEIRSPIKILLSNPVKNKKEVILAVSDFNLEPGKLENLEIELRKESKILRYLILVKPPAKISVVRTRPSVRILPKITPKEKKVELGEIEKKLKEILGE